MEKQLSIKVSAQTLDAQKRLERLSKEIDTLARTTQKSSVSQTKSFKKINNSAQELRNTILKLGSAYLGLEGAKSLVSTAGDIEKGFIGVQKTTGLAGEEFKKLKQNIYDLSTSMSGTSLEGLQSIAETAGQLGVSGRENILSFTKVIAKMVASTELSADEASASMAQLGNSLQEPIANFEKLGSTINELSNTTTATAGDVIRYSQRIAGMGKTFGLTSTQILAFASTLKDVGIEAELGGTALSEIMLKLKTQTAKFAKGIGVSVEEMTKKLKNEPIEALKLLISKLGEMDSQTRVNTLKELGLTGSGVAQTLLKLSTATDKLNKNLNTAKTAWQENTSLQKEYETASKGFNAQLERAENSIKMLAGKIGEQLLPKLKVLIDEFVKWIQSLDKEKIKEYADQIANIATAIGNVGAEIGKFTMSIASFVADNAKLIGSLYLAKKALDLLHGSMNIFSNSLPIAATKIQRVGAVSTALSRGVSLVSVALRGIIAISNPFTLALAGITGATMGAVKMAESHTKALQDEANATLKSAKVMESHTTKIEKIGQLYQKADEAMKKHGSITAETKEKIKQALQDEIKSVEAQLKTWEKVPNMTKTQEKNFLALAGTLGRLKAKLDTLDGDYKITPSIDEKALKKEEDKIRKSLKEYKILKIKADAWKAQEKIKELEKSTKSIHTVQPNTKNVIEIVQKLQRNTHSTHTIYVRTVQGRAGGGYIPKSQTPLKFSNGGRVPGYDPTDGDSVSAQLTGGEYVIRREAVDTLGVGFLDTLNNGWQVPQSQPEVLQPVNLHIGSSSYQVMSSREVAEALIQELEEGL